MASLPLPRGELGVPRKRGLRQSIQNTQLTGPQQRGWFGSSCGRPLRGGGRGCTAGCTGSRRTRRALRSLVQQGPRRGWGGAVTLRQRTRHPGPRPCAPSAGCGAPPACLDFRPGVPRCKHGHQKPAGHPQLLTPSLPLPRSLRVLGRERQTVSIGMSSRNSFLRIKNIQVETE